MKETVSNTITVRCPAEARKILIEKMRGTASELYQNKDTAGVDVVLCVWKTSGEPAWKLCEQLAAGQPELRLIFQYSFEKSYPHLYLEQIYKDGKVVNGSGQSWNEHHGDLRLEWSDFQDEEDTPLIYNQATVAELIAGLQTRDEFKDACALLLEEFKNSFNRFEAVSAAIQSNPLCLKVIVPWAFSRRDYTTLCADAVEVDGLALQYVDVDRIDEDYYYNVCKLAVEQNPKAAAFLEKAYLEDKQYEELKKMDKTCELKVPRYIIRKIAELEKKRGELKTSLGHEASDEELAAALKWPLERIQGFNRIPYQNWKGEDGKPVDWDKEVVVKC
jgi:hypothetical protein